MSKANVIDLESYREKNNNPSSASQEVPHWTHVEAAAWCIRRIDREPEVAEMLNEWEHEFLESISTQRRPATKRQCRCLNRIIYIINGTLDVLEREESPTPAA